MLISKKNYKPDQAKQVELTTVRKREKQPCALWVFRSVVCSFKELLE